MLEPLTLEHPIFAYGTAQLKFDGGKAKVARCLIFVVS